MTEVEINEQLGNYLYFCWKGKIN